MKTVLVFGAFDPLHAGHQDFFRQAKQHGDRLLVVVASDAVIRQQKHREPYLPEEERRAAVARLPTVDQALLGDSAPHEYQLLRTLSFAVVALGYDQTPDDMAVRRLLATLGKKNIAVVRLAAYKPEQYKSSFVRPTPP